LHRYRWRVPSCVTALLVVGGLGASPGLARRGRPRPAAPKTPAAAPKAAPNSTPPASAPSEPAPPAPHIQRLVFSPYVYAYQADTRRRIPLLGVRNPDGSSALTVHPWEGVGPWFSYDHTQWHKNALLQARAAGVDVLLPVFRTDAPARASFAIKGLDCLAQALKELRQEREQPGIRGRDYPLIGMYFDTGTLRSPSGGAVDLATEEGRQTFYGKVREFFLHIPPEFRAAVPLPPERARTQHPIPGSQLAPGTAHVVFLSNPSTLQNLSAAALAYSSERFTRDFGAPLLWLGGPLFHGHAEGLDGTLDAGEGGGWVQVATLSPGRDPSAASPPVVPSSATVAVGEGRQVSAQPPGPTPNTQHPTPAIDSRRLGRTYIEGWIERLRAHPDWIFIDSWNRSREGTDIQATHEFGPQYQDLTRAGANQFKGGVDYSVNILRTTAPAAIAPRTLAQVDVLVQNTGQRAWTGGMGLSYRWFKDGQPVGDPAPVAVAPYTAPGDLRLLHLGLTGPMAAGKPLPDGDYELRLDMLRPPADWFDAPSSLPYVVPVRIGSADSGNAPPRPYWLGSGMPTLARAGATYTVPIRLRNDSGVIWKKADGVAVGYRWLRVSTEGEGTVTPLEASGRADLPADVLPGAVISLEIPVRLVDDAGKPLPLSKPADPWCYQLEWDLFDGKRWASEAGAPTHREVVAALPDDLGPTFLGTGFATTQASGSTVATKVGLRNNGPEPWSALTDRVVYHWYFFDGSEARWAGLETKLPADVQPGETVVVPDVRVQVPDFTGPMYLTLDLKRGQNYASTGASSRGGDLYVLPVNIIGGAMAPVNLAPLFDTDGLSFDMNRSDGDLDGKGHTLPAESLPPYVWHVPAGAAPVETPLYPCGLWARPVNQGDRVPFWYPEKRDGGKNLLSCAGQRLEFPPDVRSAVHLLGMATETGASGDVTLIYRDGTTSKSKLEMSSWTEGPQHGEHVAFTALHRHSATADEPGARCCLYHYSLRAQRGKTLVALELPNNPVMKVMAVTLETETRPDTVPALRLPGILAPK
jgi:hypothetical protein